MFDERVAATRHATEACDGVVRAVELEEGIVVDRAHFVGPVDGAVPAVEQADRSPADREAGGQENGDSVCLHFV